MVTFYSKICVDLLTSLLLVSSDSMKTVPDQLTRGGPQQVLQLAFINCLKCRKTCVKQVEPTKLCYKNLQNLKESQALECLTVHVTDILK